MGWKQNINCKTCNFTNKLISYQNCWA